MLTFSIHVVFRSYRCYNFIHSVGLLSAPQLSRNKPFQLHVDPMLCNLRIWYVASLRHIPTLTTCTTWFGRIDINRWSIIGLHWYHSTLKTLTLHRSSLLQSIRHLYIIKFTMYVNPSWPCIITIDHCGPYHLSRFKVITLYVLVQIVDLTMTVDLSLPSP